VTAYVAHWLVAFALTVTIELGVALPLLATSGASRLRRAGGVGLANLASHPLVWFVFPQMGLTGATELFAAELFAVVVETVAYLVVWPTLGRAQAFGVSALANGASLAVGLSLRALGAPI
jgi:hypothetical protein